MTRIPRLFSLLLLLAALTACGNKGDLIKPSSGPVPAPAPAAS